MSLDFKIDLIYVLVPFVCIAIGVLIVEFLLVKKELVKEFLNNIYHKAIKRETDLSLLSKSRLIRYYLRKRNAQGVRWAIDQYCGAVFSSKYGNHKQVRFAPIPLATYRLFDPFKFYTNREYSPFKLDHCFACNKKTGWKPVILNIYIVDRKAAQTLEKTLAAEHYFNKISSGSFRSTYYTTACSQTCADFLFFKYLVNSHSGGQ